MVQGKFDVIHGWAAMKPGTKVEPWTYKPRPIGPNDVEIEIQYSGICGSDLHIIKGEWQGTSYPAIVGHEIVGRVTTKGQKVSEFTEGDVVGVGAQVYACLQDDCGQCNRGLDPHCPSTVYTYNSKYADGEQSQGGYASAIRVDANYVFKIPEAMVKDHLEYAAPLMCAGVTTFAPMIRKGVKKGDKVGIVGIGGLGHLAVQYACALGAEVYTFSHSPNKKQECLDLGASHFINTSNAEEVKSAHHKLDYLFVTSKGKADEYNDFISLMNIGGTIVLLALPEGKIGIGAGEVIFTGVSITGSLIGGIDVLKQTLEFSAKHNIRPIIERYPMEKINDALEHMNNGNARYRIVLDNLTSGN
ncbi:hypothetical protein H4S08_004015 [Coemansia sp. RSA 1365]|nr:hypothetical protein H4S08_004015 [Coemansia sp. RSA 1365]